MPPSSTPGRTNKGIIVFSVLLISLVIVAGIVSCTQYFPGNSTNTVTGTNQTPSKTAASSDNSTITPVAQKTETPARTSAPPVNMAAAVTPTTDDTLPPETLSITITTMTPTVTVTPEKTSNIDKSAFSAIDQYALGTPDAAAKSINSLAAYLAKPAKNDLEKARAVYRWITQNVSYDISAYLSGNYGSTGSTDVLTAKSSVCEGYSNLFQSIAQAMGLEVVTIDGWAKGLSYHIGDQIDGRTNHAWNAVKIDEGWYLIDSTWGAGYIDQQNNFVRQFIDEYFLTPPEQFIYRHFPEDPQWQLLPNPISKSMFVNLPWVWDHFFSYDLRLDNSTSCIIKSDGNVNIPISAPSNVALLASLMQENQYLPKYLSLAQRSGDKYQIYAICPDAGTYVLRISAKYKNDPGDYQAVLDYRVDSNQASISNNRFPVTYGKFYTSDAYVYSPLNGVLKQGTVQHFRLSIPTAVEVQIVMGEQWYPLTEHNGQFEGDVNITQGPLQVCVKLLDSNSEQYSVLLEYSVQ